MKSIVWDFLLMSIMSDLILVGVSGLAFAAARAWLKFPKDNVSQQKIMKKIDLKFNLKRCTVVIISCVAIIFIILRAPQNIDAKEILEFNRDLQNYNAKLQIIDSKQRPVAEFSIAIADTEEKKIYGLMNLDQLPKDFGMLFPFEKSQIIAMWMKNTRIPLDMIFIGEDDLIVNIAADTTPQSLDIISSEKETKKVLEVNAGVAEKLKIKVGQKVLTHSVN